MSTTTRQTKRPVFIGRLHEQHIMSISELASCSGVSVKVIQGQIDAGKLTAKSIGGKVFVRVSDFWNSLNSVEVVTESAT